MVHARKKSFYPKPSSLFRKLFFEVGSTLIIIQRESENMIWKADFGLKMLHRVRFEKKKNTTRQILIWGIYNASDFGLKKNDALDFESKMKSWLHSKNHLLVHLTPWKRHTLHFSCFSKKHDFVLKITLLVRFWNETKYHTSDFEINFFRLVTFWLKNLTTCQILN